jgi:hypothetical protein
VNNTFKDKATGLSFLIPYHRQLKPEEAADTVRRWMAQQKNHFFRLWKDRKQNENWRGDEDAKKEELFEKFYAPRRSSEILLEEVFVEESGSKNVP